MQIWSARLSDNRQELQSSSEAKPLRETLSESESRTKLRLAEGIGFEPTVQLPARLISSQVP